MESKRQVTIYDIAKALGVSTGTVNRALHNKPEISAETKRKVLEMAEKMDFKMNPAAQSLRRKAVRIGIFLICSVENYLMEIKRGMDGALAEIGAYNIQAEYFISFSDDCSSIRKEIGERLQQCAKAHYDGVIFLPAGNTEPFYDTFRELQKQGIRIAGVTADLWNMEDIISVSIHGESAGGLAAEVLNLCCRERNIGILTGDADKKPHNEYIAGFRKYSAHHPFRSIRIYEHYDIPALVEEMTYQMLRECPELDGVYMATASAPIACRIMEKMDPAHAIHIVTTDLMEETRDLLSRHVIRATIFQNPYLQGKKVVELLYRQICGKEMTEKYHVYPQVVFTANMNRL